jgi:plasmid stabilization system protein ParE
MLLVEWRPAAEDDLHTILTYIAEANVKAATDRYLNCWMKSVITLAKHSSIYQVRYCEVST